MTKAELFAALAALPDDGKVLIEAQPTGAPRPHDGDLFDIGHTAVIGAEGDERAFGVISPSIEYPPELKC